MARRIKLPPNPTARQLRRALRAEQSGAFVAPRAVPKAPGLKHISSWINLTEATGVPMSAETLRRWFQRHDWAITFKQLAMLAAMLANSPDGPYDVEVRAQTVGLLSQAASVGVIEGILADFVAAQPPSRVIAHEEVIYFLQSLAISEGSEGGEALNGAQLAYLMMAANDHLVTWPDDGPELRPELDNAVASILWCSRFNRHEDPLRRFVRAALMLEGPPSKGRFSDASRWQQLQLSAFGMPFQRFFDCYVGPLAGTSMQWGRRQKDGLLGVPAITPSAWHASTILPASVGEDYLRSLTSTRDEARTALTKLRHSSGLPRAFTPLYRKPFLATGDDQIVGASPWLVRTQLSAGLWARFRHGAVHLDPKRGSSDWPPAFGYLFEDWCRRVADLAQATPGFVGKVIVSKAPGDVDEVEDVVLVRGDDVILFSAKARQIPEAVAKEATTKGAILGWLEEFLAAPRDRARGQRAGALDLLSAKVERVRTGAYEPSIPRHARIYPVLVTFEDLGENEILYMWIQELCRRKKLFRHRDVAPVCLAYVDEYEALMGLAASGANVFEIFARRRSPEAKFERLDVLIADLAKGRAVRLPALEKIFLELVERAAQGLFGMSHLRDARTGEGSEPDP